MGHIILLLCLYFSVHLNVSEACTIDGVTQWFEPQNFYFKDTHRGLIITQNTENVQGINSLRFGEGLNRGPYLEVSHSNSVFSVETTDAFANYEEYETELSISFTITFGCTGGSSRTLIYVFNINDTNNHAPTFQPTNSFEFSLALPVPPGFKVSGCDYIIVRDIDLTTQRIAFDIEDNPYFEIVYHGQTQPKEFGGFIRTKTLIRSLPETLTFTITATDVDLTGDEPLTSSASVRIVADNAFRLPETPVFSAAFYEADYTDEHDLNLREGYISIREGYDDQVQFRFEGEYAEYFSLLENENRLSFQVVNPLPEDISESPILLIILAEREFTSGASATVVIHLPRDIILQFESALYEGQIEDNVLKTPNLTLLHGYQEITRIDIINEYAAYFSANRDGNIITLLMNSLPTDVIQNNNVLNIEVIVSTNRNITASSIVVLEIIKDDYVTPVFERLRYNGTYDPETGLTLEPIIFLQGFDNTVSVSLKGDYSRYFEEVVQNAEIMLTASIPPEMWSARTMLITVEATKPRTVGANTAVLINLPTARNLSFQEPAYRGSIENNKVLLEIIELSVGYETDVNFVLSGEFSSYFSTNNTQNQVTISLQNELPENIILENNALMLFLSASGPNAMTASTNILLDIIRDDHVTPVFEKVLYNGVYDPTTGLSLEDIVIIQGFDETVKVTLEGEHAQLFTLEQEGPRILINGTVSPETWPEQNLILRLKATKPRTVGANTVIHIILPPARKLSFEQSSYGGSIYYLTHTETNELTLETIVLSLGYATDVSFELSGKFSSYFAINNTQNEVTITLQNELPENILLENNALMLTLSASGLNALTTFTNILLDIIRDDHITPVFEKALYNGVYDPMTGLALEDIVIIQGFDETVDVILLGDHSQLFVLESKGPTVTVNGTVPTEIWPQQNLILSLKATKPRTVGANAVIHITLPAARELSFKKSAYTGIFRYDTVTIEEITLSVGYNPDVVFELTGEHSEHFVLSNEENKLSLSLNDSVTEEFSIENSFIVLTIGASGPNAIPTLTTVFLEIIKNDTTTPVFSQQIYQGVYKNMSDYYLEQISLVQGYDSTVSFSLEGDHAQYFEIDVIKNNVSILLKTAIPEELIFKEKRLLFKVSAEKDLTVGATAIVSIQFPADLTEPTIMGFSKSAYVGTLQDDNLEITQRIILETGYARYTQFKLNGEYADYFELTSSSEVVTISLIKSVPAEKLEDTSFIVLEIEAQRERAVTTTTILVVDIINADEIVVPTFEKPLYNGTLSREDGLQFEQLIRLATGYDETVIFSLEGDDSQWFTLNHISSNNIGLSLKAEGLPEDFNQNHLIFSIVASKPENLRGRSTIFISFTDSSTDPGISFDKILYSGIIRNGNVQHESITILGFTGTNIVVSGQYGELFEANLRDKEVTITAKTSAVLPNVSHVALELQAGSARAVLVLNVIEPDTPELPTVTFESPSYVLRVDVTHTGSVGRVQATSDNGEAITYSLNIDNDHLRQRLTVSNDGELRLSAPANSGMYSFQVVAWTVFTRASATVPVHLGVEAASVCGSDIVVPPLIILDRDEEQAHRNLVILDQTKLEGCSYTLSNIWPERQSWLYVDKDGLHTTSIDREHESIAFMTVSQIQVELILECESDVTSRTKRSLGSKSTADWIGPYEYGSNKWILTDTIPYNARRSLVNLIVNDINDNTPIFVGKENEPIVVGYPVSELENIILPTALVELKATDADIGENAALVYWSEDESLAVSPSTGFVHVRNSSNLQSDASFTVHATDQNGAGHTGSLVIMVKLLERNHIAVLNIQNAFLEQEVHILGNLSNTAGYEIRTLKTVAVSESIHSHSMRDASNVLGASLQLFVYGLIEREPVDIKKLIADINSDLSTVNVGSIISLEDHLKANEICEDTERDSGLLAATIVLSVLLFILIVALCVWLFLKRRKNDGYDEFSGRNSNVSLNTSVEEPKSEIVAKPRLNIEDLKRSERKLQERLDAPITEDPGETSGNKDHPMEAIINISTPDPQMPIIIQTIDKLKDNTEESDDDDDVFGERMKSRRKSVVTFNENVEKIIHVEDNPENKSVNDYEVFKL